MRRMLLIILLLSLPILAVADDVPNISDQSNMSDAFPQHDPELPDPHNPKELAAFFSPSTKDVSVSLLSSIFGTVGTTLHGNATIMGDMFAVFNLAVLSLAGLVLIYILFVSILNCSYEGEMMKEHHSMWGPFRTVIAIGLMMPGFTGYNGMQLIVMWVVKQGVGAADQIWNVTLDHLMLGESILVAPMTPNMIDTKSNFSSVQGTDTSGNMGDRVGQLLTAVSCMGSMQTVFQQQRNREMDKPRGQQFNKSCQPSNIKDGNFWCAGDYPDFISTVDIIGAQSAALTPDRNGNVSDHVTVNFPSFADSSPYSVLNGVCGSMTFNTVDRDQAAKQLGNSFGEGGTASKLENLQMARGLAVQQVFLDVSNLFRRIFANEANFSNMASPPRTLPLGEPLDNNTSWGARNGMPSLLNGGEIWDATTDYYSILTPTLNLLMNGGPSRSSTNCLPSSGGINCNPKAAGHEMVILQTGPPEDTTGTDFIYRAKDDGLILAGSYYWNVATLNRQQNQFFNDLDNFTVDTTGAQALGNGLGNGNEALSNAIDNNALTREQIDLLSGFLGNQPDDRFETNNTISQYVKNAIKYGFNSNNQVQNRGPNLAGLSRISLDIHSDVPIVQDVMTMINGFKNAFHFSGGLFGWKSIFSFITQTLIQLIAIVASAMINVANTIMQLVINMFSAEILSVVNQVENTINQDLNPLIGLSELGNMILNSAITMWTLGGMLAVLLMAGGASVLSGLVGILMVVLPAFSAMLLAMFTAGMLLAYYLPLLPYLIFTLGGVAWLIGVIEAMCAAPIVAMGLMYPEGHKVFGYAGDKTLMLLLNVFLRPSMMVIGFIAAMLLASAGVKLINMGFYQALVMVVGHTNDGFNAGDNGAWTYQMTQMSSLSGLLGVLVIVGIYVYLVWTVVEKSCELIYLIPDKVLRWLQGGLEEPLGQGTASMVQNMKSGMQSMAETSGKTMQGLAHGAGQQAAESYKEASKVKATPT